MHKTVNIENNRIKYTLECRDVIHTRLEFKTGKLLIIMPKKTNEKEEEIIDKHKKWILTRYYEINSAITRGKKKKLNKKRTDEVLKHYVNKKADIYFNEIKVARRNLRFQEMKSKWASCSSKMITVNTLLKYLPDKLIDYVIFHEIVHLIERKHNRGFWKIVEKRFKNIKSKEKDLMMYWFLIQNKYHYYNTSKQNHFH